MVDTACVFVLACRRRDGTRKIVDQSRSGRFRVVPCRSHGHRVEHRRGDDVAFERIADEPALSGRQAARRVHLARRDGSRGERIVELAFVDGSPQSVGANLRTEHGREVPFSEVICRHRAQQGQRCSLSEPLIGGEEEGLVRFFVDVRDLDWSSDRASELIALELLQRKTRAVIEPVVGVQIIVAKKLESAPM